MSIAAREFSPRAGVTFSRLADPAAHTRPGSIDLLPQRAQIQESRKKTKLESSQ
jgi:hypothetical protein